MSAPTVSVIIPCYNGASYLAQTIESVLAQTYTDLELIVVDDCSSDDSVDVIGRYLDDDRVRLVRHEENRGIAASRNTGARHAEGRYLAFLDQDDLWHTRKLECQVAVLDNDPEERIGLVYCPRETLVEGRGIVGPGVGRHTRVNADMGRRELLTECLRGNFVTMMSVVVRRSCFEEVGGLDDSIRSGADDYDFVVRVAGRYRLHCVDEVLVTRREHQGNYTNAFKIIPDSLKIIERIAQAEPALEPMRRRRESTLLHDYGVAAQEQGDMKTARKNYKAALGANPKNAKAAAAYVLSCLGPVGYGVLRTWRAIRGTGGSAVLLLMLAPLVLSNGCAKSGPPNFLLITVDTLRLDRMHYAGNSRTTSNTIDEIAQAGRVYTNAFSVSGWTLPSIASMLTGRQPKDHGATDFHWSVDPSLTSLASILRRKGYMTRGYVSHILLKPEYGVAEGFERFDYSVLRLGHPHNVATARELTSLVVSELDTVEGPFFIWVHYFDPHFAYLSHPRWSQWGNEHIDRYDQEIAHTDHQIGRLLDEMGQRGLLDNTVVTFTADHGEEFMDHGHEYHFTLFDEVLRVPLVMNGPGVEPGVDDRWAEQVDFMPTILNLAGLSVGDIALPGRDLLAPPGPDQPIFAERDRPPPYIQRSIRMGHHKLTVVDYADTTKIPASSRGTAAPFVAVPGVHMYDLAADPLEQVDVYSEDNDLAMEMLGRLLAHFSDQPASRQEVHVDEELANKLRSLGYIR